MPILTGPLQGKAVQFDVSPEGEQRIVIGLAWDPRDLLKTPRRSSSQPKPLQTMPGWKNVSRNILNTLAYIIGQGKHHATDISRAARNLHHVRSSTNQNDTPARDIGFDHFDLDLYCYIFDAEGKFRVLVGPELENAADPHIKIYHSGESFSGSGGGIDDEQIHINTRDLPVEYTHFLIVVKSDCKFSLDEINRPVIRVADSKLEKNVLQSVINPPPQLDASAFVFCHLWKNKENWNVLNINDFYDFNSDWEKILSGYLERKVA